MKITITKPHMAVVLKLLADREKELSEQGATENQIGAVRIIRKKLSRQLGQQLGHGRKKSANHKGQMPEQKQLLQGRDA